MRCATVDLVSIAVQLMYLERVLQRQWQIKDPVKSRVKLEGFDCCIFSFNCVNLLTTFHLFAYIIKHIALVIRNYWGKR